MSIKGLIERLLEWDEFGGQGRGWDREANMSVNAVDAIKSGSRFISQWTKTGILDYMVQEGADTKIIQIAKELDIKWLKLLFLKSDEWHHVGKRYKKVDFYHVKIFDYDTEFFDDMRRALVDTITNTRKVDFYTDRRIQNWVRKYLGEEIFEALLELSDIYIDVSSKSIPKDYHGRIEKWRETYGDSAMYVKPFN